MAARGDSRDRLVRAVTSDQQERDGTEQELARAEAAVERNPVDAEAVAALVEQLGAARDRLTSDERRARILRLTLERLDAEVPADAPIAEILAASVEQIAEGPDEVKAQVQHMVQLLLKPPAKPAEDAADALAVAICHAHHSRMQTISDQPRPGRSIRRSRP